MAVITEFSETLSHIATGTLAHELENQVALHIFDTLTAIFSGWRLQETRLLSDAMADPVFSPHESTPSVLHRPLNQAIVQLCAAARCTEIDDIHLSSCVTPSAIIVPMAIATAARLPEITGQRLLTACLAGYEAMIRVGLAINGPGILYRGIWPTYLCAGFGTAVAGSNLLGLTKGQMAHALAIAAAMATGINARSDSPSAKWFLVGMAAQNGLMAALAAKRGLQGDLGLLDKQWGALLGIELDAAALIRLPEGRRHIQDVTMKPWCGARQAMSALAGFTTLLATKPLNPETLSEIRVEVPAAYVQMIDRPELPSSRQESFANVRYLFGLAAFAPDSLYDVAREDLHVDSRFRVLARKIRILHGQDLDSYYPEHWPARVTVEDAAGQTYVEEVIHAPGDVERPLGWEGASEKFWRVTGRSPADAERIARACRGLGAPDGLAGFRAVVEPEFAPPQIGAD